MIPRTEGLLVVNLSSHLKMRVGAVVLFFASAVLGMAMAEPIACRCHANSPRIQDRRCDRWCGERCLKYLREELLIMDLAHCRDSTV